LSATITSAAIASPFHELARAVHGGVEICFSLHASAFAARAVGIEHPGVHVGIDRHLLPGHRVEHEARSHLRHALAPLGDDDELNHRENEEDDTADDVVSADDEATERVNDLSGVGLQQNQSRRRDVEPEPIERGEQEDGRESRDRQRVRHVQDHEKNGDCGGQVRRNEDIEQPGRQRHDHHRDDRDDEERERRIRGPEAGRAWPQRVASRERAQSPHARHLPQACRRRRDPSAGSGRRARRSSPRPLRLRL
jgi:hypothetical protein